MILKSVLSFFPGCCSQTVDVAKLQVMLINKCWKVIENSKDPNRTVVLSGP